MAKDGRYSAGAGAVPNLLSNQIMKITPSRYSLGIANNLLYFSDTHIYFPVAPTDFRVSEALKNKVSHRLVNVCVAAKIKALFRKVVLTCDYNNDSVNYEARPKTPEQTNSPYFSRF